MTLPYDFHLGVDAEDYETPTYSVSYSNWDLDEGLPDEELVGEVMFQPDFDIPECTLRRLPEECPGMVHVNEEDFGDE